jgi:hypothetical protein
MAPTFILKNSFDRVKLVSGRPKNLLLGDFHGPRNPTSAGESQPVAGQGFTSRARPIDHPCGGEMREQKPSPEHQAAQGVSSISYISFIHLLTRVEKSVY